MIGLILSCFSSDELPLIIQCSVMKSDGNIFGGDVVSDSFNKTSRYEDNILEQINKSEYVRIIIMMILILYNIIRKCILTLQ